jgi:hypothetical protein
MCNYLRNFYVQNCTVLIRLFEMTPPPINEFEGQMFRLFSRAEPRSPNQQPVPLLIGLSSFVVNLGSISIEL